MNAELKRRLVALETRGAARPVREMTDAELLAIVGLGESPTDEQLLAVIGTGGLTDEEDRHADA